MREDRHPRVALDALHQAATAARHDDVDAAGGAPQHGAHGLAVTRRHELDNILRHARIGEAGAQGVGDGGGAAERRRAGTQDHRVAGHQAERRGVRRHVGAALVDDADHTERRRDALDAEPVGARPGGEDAAHRVGQRGDIVDRAGDGGDALPGERRPVAKGGVALHGGEIGGVGLKDRRRRRADPGSHRRERGLLRLGGSQREAALRGAGAGSHLGEKRVGVGRVVGSGEGQRAHGASGGAKWSAMSSRWTMVARARAPTIAGSECVFCPAIKRASLAS